MGEWLGMLGLGRGQLLASQPTILDRKFPIDRECLARKTKTADVRQNCHVSDSATAISQVHA